MQPRPEDLQGDHRKEFKVAAGAASIIPQIPDRHPRE
jgi:hypothetical protein